jgi:hypothetical protein
MRRRMFGGVFALALLAASMSAVAAGSGAATPTAGPVQVWITPNNTAVYKIVLTGAIGDHGTATSMTKSGKVDPNGHYVKIKLQNGTFEVNSVELDKKTATAPPTMIDKTTCSFYFVGKGPVTLSDGTGEYSGISGTLAIIETFAGVGPLYKTGPKKGQCNMSNSAQPVAFWSSLLGAGIVKFS